MTDQRDQHWRKSSHSSTNPDCVELSLAPDLIVVRDSKSTAQILYFPPEEFATFLRIVDAMGHKT